MCGAEVRANELPARHHPITGQRLSPGGGSQSAEVGVVRATELPGRRKAPPFDVRDSSQSKLALDA